jgi:hypothetical protein
MICVTCAQLMERFTRATPSGEHIVTTHLCLSCMSRKTTTADNPRFVPNIVEKRPPNRQARCKPWTPMPEDV